MEDFIARGMNLDIEFGSDCRMANVVTYNRNFITCSVTQIY